jgi:hypothetical protein
MERFKSGIEPSGLGIYSGERLDISINSDFVRNSRDFKRELLRNVTKDVSGYFWGGALSYLD